MGVFTYSDEFTSPIPPARLFKALMLDFNNLIPKLLPQVIKSIEFIQGDGGVGSIRQINFQEGLQTNYVKSRIDVLEPEKCLYSITLIEGDELLDKLEKIVYEVQFVPGSDSGSIKKMKSSYYTKGDNIVLNEEEVKAGKEKAVATYKLVEGYLLQNPDAYV